jgi:hypothetical protein
VSQSIDLLMVTYQAPESTRLSLGRLLETCDERMRVWLWHNGEHAETLAVVLLLDRRACTAVCPDNKRLWGPPTGCWITRRRLPRKVDDDNVPSLDLEAGRGAQRLRPLRGIAAGASSRGLRAGSPTEDSRVSG